ARLVGSGIFVRVHGSVRCRLYRSSALMEIAFLTVGFLVVGLLIGGGAVALAARGRLRALGEQAERERSAAVEKLERERATAEAKLELVQRLDADWESRFKELSASALAQNNTSFLTLAETKLSPLAATLTQFEQQTRALEQSRQTAYTQLTTQI